MALEQRLAALEVSRVRRKAVANLKKELAALDGFGGSLLLAGVLRSYDLQSEAGELLGPARVVALLDAIRGVGEERAYAYLRTAGITQRRRLRGLSARQRNALAEVLEDRATNQSTWKGNLRRSPRA